MGNWENDLQPAISSESLSTLILVVSLMSLFSILDTFLRVFQNRLRQESAMLAQGALNSLLYCKTLRLSPQAKANTEGGKVNSLFGSDSAQAIHVWEYAFNLCMVPIVLGVGFYLLYGMVGSAMLYGLAGIGIMLWLIICPLASIAKNFRALSKHRDARVSLQKEFLENIKVLKMYAWDIRFEERIMETRSTELAHLSGMNYAAIQILALMGSFDNVLILSIIISYIGQGNSLTAEVIFPVISLIHFLKIYTQFVPVCAAGFVQFNISIGRINAYLRKPEVIKSTSSDGAVLYGAGRTHEDAAEIRGGASFKWTPIVDGKKQAKKDGDQHSVSEGSLNPFSLENIDVVFPRGRMTLIVGATGSGKSSLLSALQGDLLPVGVPTEQGPRLGGRVAMCTQIAFIQSDTIRNAILFGRPFVQEEYDEVLECCCLLQDLKEMPAGDLSEIGERGINLSGGQKHRIALARAIYFQPRTLILDDVLAAVDAQISAKIIEKCLCGPNSICKRKNITLIMAAHQLQLAQHADHIVVMHKENDVSTIKEQGSFDDLNSLSTGALHAMLEEHQTEVNEEQRASSLDLTRSRSVSAVSDAGSAPISRCSSFASSEGVEKSDAGKLVADEEQSVGTIGWDTYAYYISQVGSMGFFICFILMKLLANGCSARAQPVYQYWADNTLNFSTEQYLTVVVILVSASLILSALSSFIFLGRTVKASEGIYHEALLGVSRAPMAFFDTTPVGRILNQLGDDIRSLDMSLPFLLNMMVTLLFLFCFTLIIVLQSVPYVIIVVLPIVAYTKRVMG